MVITVYEGIVRTQYVIMNILRKNKATNYMKSMTLEEISDEEGRNKSNTIYKHIRILQEKKLVEIGAKVEMPLADDSCNGIYCMPTENEMGKETGRHWLIKPYGQPFAEIRFFIMKNV